MLSLLFVPLLVLTIALSIAQLVLTIPFSILAVPLLVRFLQALPELVCHPLVAILCIDVFPAAPLQALFLSSSCCCCSLFRGGSCCGCSSGIRTSSLWRVSASSCEQHHRTRGTSIMLS